MSGASTLTMQVARMLRRRPRTLRAKVVEAFVAVQLEMHMSKDEILTAYLNLAPLRWQTLRALARLRGSTTENRCHNSGLMSRRLWPRFPMRPIDSGRIETRMRSEYAATTC